MNARSHNGPDCSEVVLSMLDWLDRRDDGASTIDEALSVLADHRRRLLVEVIRTHDDGLTLPDAAEEVACMETGEPLPDIDPEHVAAVYLELYHDHLPRLVDAGLLDYEQERDLVLPATSR